MIRRSVSISHKNASRSDSSTVGRRPRPRALGLLAPMASMVLGLIACAPPADDKAAAPGHATPEANSPDGGTSTPGATKNACAPARPVASCAAGKASLSPATNYPNAIDLLSYMGAGDINGDGK